MASLAGSALDEVLDVEGVTVRSVEVRGLLVDPDDEVAALLSQPDIDVLAADDDSAETIAARWHLVEEPPHVSVNPGSGDVFVHRAWKGRAVLTTGALRLRVRTCQSLTVRTPMAAVPSSTHSATTRPA